MPSTTIKYFAFAHPPPKLQSVSKPLGELAEKLEALLPDGPEKSVGMRKLLEAKDCFVRCAIDMPETTQDKLLAHASGTAEGFTVPTEVPPHQARVIGMWFAASVQSFCSSDFLAVVITPWARRSSSYSAWVRMYCISAPEMKKPRYAGLWIVKIRDGRSLFAALAGSA